MTTAHDTGYVPEFERHDRLAKAILSSGYTRAKVAEFVGVRPETMSRYLSGKSTPPLSVVRSIAQFTGVSFTWIQTGEAPSPGGDGASHVRPEVFETPTFWLVAHDADTCADDLAAAA